MLGLSLDCGCTGSDHLRPWLVPFKGRFGWQVGPEIHGSKGRPWNSRGDILCFSLECVDGRGSGGQGKGEGPAAGWEEDTHEIQGTTSGRGSLAQLSLLPSPKVHGVKIWGFGGVPGAHNQFRGGGNATL